MKRTTCDGAVYMSKKYHKGNTGRFFCFNQARPTRTVFGVHSIFKSGRLVSVKQSRKSAIDYCNKNEEEGSVFHIRVAGKLMYFKEYKQQPIFFNGFHVERYIYKTYAHTIADFENHTSMEKTLKYEAITHALEQAANETQGVQ